MRFEIAWPAVVRPVIECFGQDLFAWLDQPAHNDEKKFQFRMIPPDQQSAHSGSEQHNVAAESRAEFIRALYRGFLDREPASQEVAGHVDRLARGETEAEIVTSFAQSEECRIVRSQRCAQDAGVRARAYIELESAPLAIRADDVLQVITQVMTLSSRQEPSFDEVALKFEEFQRGADLAMVLNDSSLGPLKGEQRELVEQVIRLLYLGTLHRIATATELESWFHLYLQDGRVSTLVTAIAESQEARRFTDLDVSQGVLVQMAFEIILDRGATAHELDVWRQRLEQGTHTVSGIVLRFFLDRMGALLQSPDGKKKNNPCEAYLFGTRGVVDAEEWDVPPDPERRRLSHDALGRGSMFAFNETEDCVVSILTSLYMGGDYVRSFLENITSQTIFRDHCELIIIDACSPQNEAEVIAEFQREFPNIIYRRCDTRIGIYEAWNIAARLARGKYCTNANLDDCRRNDSLEIQAATLDSLPFVDVAYQDVLYSFEGGIPFKEIEAHDLRTELPIVSRYNLTEFNSPHNAPMWRKSLHADIGYFDETFKSAGDFDFWIRCLIGGKTFYKSNAAHVGYYVNPEGLSTCSDTRGVEEAWAISRAHYRKIISSLVTSSHEQFIAAVRNVAEMPVTTAPTGYRYDIVQAALRDLGSESRSCIGGKSVTGMQARFRKV